MFCFGINLRPKCNSLTVLLFCHLCFCCPMWPKGQTSSWGEIECVGVCPFWQQLPELRHPAQVLQRVTHLDTHTHTTPHSSHQLPHSYYSTLSPPFSRISHAFLYCGAVPDFMGTGPEWRQRITSTHYRVKVSTLPSCPPIQTHWMEWSLHRHTTDGIIAVLSDMLAACGAKQILDGLQWNLWSQENES